MIGEWAALLGVFSTTLLAPASGLAVVEAQDPIALPLPQEINFQQDVSNTLTLARFTTAIRGFLRTAVGLADAQPNVKTSVTTFYQPPSQCLSKGRRVRFNLYMENDGNAMARDVRVAFQLPSGTKLTFSNPSRNPQNPLQVNNGVLYWGQGHGDASILLAPGASRQFIVEVEMLSDLTQIEGNMFVQHFDDAGTERVSSATGIVRQFGTICGGPGRPSPSPSPSPTPSPTLQPSPSPSPSPLPTLDPTPEPIPPQIEVYIINDAECSRVGDELIYKVGVRNVSEGLAENVVLRNTIPEGTELIAVSGETTIPPPNATEEEIRATQTIVWPIGTLKPTEFEEREFRVRVITALADLLSGAYIDNLTGTCKSLGGVLCEDTAQDVIPNQCPEPSVTPEPPPPKRPAIVCDPGDALLECEETYKDLDFGPNYNRVVNDEDRQPKNDFKALRDDVRFREAMADIIPGECRVIPDDIISDLAYHDAFTRFGADTSFYLEPLGNSAKDYKRFVQENALIGIEFQTSLRDSLRRIHRSNWNEHIDIVLRVLSGEIDAQEGQRRITASIPVWVARVRAAQPGFLTGYQQLQERRKIGGGSDGGASRLTGLFDDAVNNAKSSIQRACGIENDGGLAQTLPPVEQFYVQTLDQRARYFDQVTQKEAIDIYGRLLQDWSRQYAVAAGNDRLKDYLAEVRGEERASFDAYYDARNVLDSLLEAYKNHWEGDEEVDDVIRRERFEVALDRPKIFATNCERETVFRPPVETTFCESQRNLPQERVIQEITPPQRSLFSDIFQIIFPKNPPESIDGSGEAVNPFDPNYPLAGVSCGGRPGDPWWASDCSCRCADFVSTSLEPLILPCKIDASNTALPPYKVQVFEESDANISAHDIFVTTRDECLQDVKVRHDAFF